MYTKVLAYIGMRMRAYNGDSHTSFIVGSLIEASGKGHKRYNFV